MRATALRHRLELDAVAAGPAAGLGVIGIGGEATRELLQGFGAARTVASLAALLERRLVTL